MFNKVILVGRLVSEPQSTQTNNGTVVTTLRIAVNEKVGDREETLFIDVKTFGNFASMISQADYYTKGRLILVDGKLRMNEYEDKSGIKRKAIWIYADTIRLFYESNGDKNKSNPSIRNTTNNMRDPYYEKARKSLEEQKMIPSEPEFDAVDYDEFDAETPPF